MIRRNLSLPILALIAGTRAMGGAGIGFLLADRLRPDQRRAVGWTLLGVGVLTTIPLLANVLLDDSEPRQPSAIARTAEQRDLLSASASV
jgi:hypothetical protein